MSELRSFPALSSNAFQHPLDTAAQQVLSRTPGLDLLAKQLSGTVFERLANIEYLGHCVRVDVDQYPKIYRTYVDLAVRLDVDRLPDLYIKGSPEPNAFTRGVEKRQIVVHTALLELLDKEELPVALAHELGHVKCDHMKYLTMVWFLRELGPAILNLLHLPLAPAMLLGAQAALVHWYQKSELSADRAALLATQDLHLVECALAKLAGFSRKHIDTLNIARLRQQAADFDDLGTTSFVESALKVWSQLQLTHPVPVVRLREIAEWSESSDYQRLIAGGDPGSAISSVRPLRICPQCGSLEPTTSAFCGNCGRDIRAAAIIARQSSDA